MSSYIGNWQHVTSPARERVTAGGLPTFWRRMRDLSASTWVIPRFLGKRVIKDKLPPSVITAKSLSVLESPTLDVDNAKHRV